MNRFTPRKAASRLTEDQVDRESRTMRRAIEILGAPAAIAFLNAEHPELSEQPLAHAIRSQNGMETVLRLIAAQEAA